MIPKKWMIVVALLVLMSVTLTAVLIFLQPGASGPTGAATGGSEGGQAVALFASEPNCAAMGEISASGVYRSTPNVTDSAGISEYSIQWNIGSSTNGLWLQSMIATQGGANQWLVELWKGSTLLWGNTPPLPFHRLMKGDGFKLGFDSSTQNATISLNGSVKYASSVRIPSNQPRVIPTSQVLVFVGSASGLPATFAGLDVHGQLNAPGNVSSLRSEQYNGLNGGGIHCATLITGEKSNAYEVETQLNASAVDFEVRTSK